MNQTLTKIIQGTKRAVKAVPVILTAFAVYNCTAPKSISTPYEDFGNKHQQHQHRAGQGFWQYTIDDNAKGSVDCLLLEKAGKLNVHRESIEITTGKHRSFYGQKFAHGKITYEDRLEINPNLKIELLKAIDGCGPNGKRDGHIELVEVNAYERLEMRNK